ncbi:MAG TPA: diacylglycerol kinase family protein [Thermomicrobiaceae bacterium]|nr:diacylglycerol kinase family protein [Thermomicrobiaceae bacterium]
MPAIEAIVNPASANGRTGKRWPELRARLEARGFTVNAHATSARGEATCIARRLAEAGVGEIVVVGGDGTLNEVANGLLGLGPEAPRPVLSLIPAGTGRDVARSLGINAAEQAIDLIGRAEPCPIDAGAIHFLEAGAPRTRYFVGFADVGLGAEAAARLNRSSKALGGFLSYLAGVTLTVATFHGREARVMVDGQLVHEGRIGMVVLCNGRYLAGGMDMAPMASMHDGRFEIFVLKDVPKRVLLGSLLPRVYRGKHVGHWAVRHYQGQCVEVSAPEPVPFQSDGEQPGTTDIRAEIFAGALLMRAPRREPARAAI